MHSGNVQHGADGFYTLVQTTDKLGVCSLKRKFRSGDNLCAKFVFEAMNKDAVPRGLCTWVSGIGIERGVEGDKEE